MSQNEFQLLQEQIKSLTSLVNAQFEGTHERLDKINGKVAKHDEQIQEALIERAKNREEQKQVKESAQENCARISVVEKSLQEYNMIMKYPKLFVAGFIVVLVLTFLTFIDSNKTVGKALGLEPQKTEISK